LISRIILERNNGCGVAKHVSDVSLKEHVVGSGCNNNKFVGYFAIKLEIE
jgi:hypothetical protein